MRKQLILVSFVGALLGAGTLHAQTPPAGMKGRDCSQAADPKACEERRAQMRQAHEQAEAFCKGRAEPDHRACMTEQTCAQAKDPAQCQARMGKRAPHAKDCSKAADPKACQERQARMRQAFQTAQAACKAKEGPDHHACMVDNMCAQAKDPAECRARAAKGGHRGQG